MLASKIYESYALDWLKAEVKLKMNQYGGVKGLGTEHVLVQYLEEVLENLEDYRAGAVITSVDYSKAFNRMSFQHCLSSLARKGTPSQLLRVIATFLTNRTMTGEVGEVRSAHKEVHGGCPQGSILGVFLFNATIDNLEDGYQDIHDSRPHGQATDREDDPGLISTDESDEEENEECQLGPSFLTPMRNAAAAWPADESPVVRYHATERRLLSRSRSQPVHLEFSFKAREDVPEEPNHRTEAKWKEKLALLLRFVDDGFALSKINFENSYGFVVNGQSFRVEHAIQAQNIFRHIARAAEEIGMKVNTSKTSMMCVSDSLAYAADAFILDSDGNRIGCTDNIKC